MKPVNHLDRLSGTAREQVGDDATTKKVARLRPSDQTTPLDDAIERVFFDIWEKYHTISHREQEELEIELRLGMIMAELYRWKAQDQDDVAVAINEQNRLSIGDGTSFRAGVDESFVNELLSFVLRESMFASEEQPIQRVKIDRDRNRYEISASNAISSYENKERLSVCDIGLLGRNYDLRVAVAREVKGATVPTSLNVSNIQFEKERLKKRTSFRPIGAAQEDLGMWRLDLTEITSFDLDLSGQRAPAKINSVPSQLKDLELEVELMQDSKMQWLSLHDPSAAKAKCQQLVKSFRKLLDLLIPHEAEPILSKSTGISLIPQNSPEFKEIIGEIQRINAQLNPSSSSSQYVQFLGSKPLNMNRRGLYRVQSNAETYFMTEKSDGIRNLLYVIEMRSKSGQPMAVLMNRVKAINLYLIPFGDIIGRALKTGTVLDGELVYNLSLKKPVFLVFDVICNEGINISQRPFEYRLGVLNNEVMKKCATIVPMHRSSAPKGSMPPLDIIRKQYYGHLVAMGASRRTSITDLLRNISFEGRDVVYYDSDRRHHKIDGIIFQPNRPYLFGSADPFLLKWKYAHLRSVDLQVPTAPSLLAGMDPPEFRIPLQCSGPDGVLLDITRRSNEDFTMFGKFDQYRLLANINDGRLIANRPRIVEVYFDESCGCWKYLKLRVDKDEPNYIDTVVGVLTEQGEDISIEELELTLLPSFRYKNGSQLIRVAVDKAKKLLLKEQKEK